MIHTGSLQAREQLALRGVSALIQGTDAVFLYPVFCEWLFLAFFALRIGEIVCTL